MGDATASAEEQRQLERLRREFNANNADICVLDTPGTLNLWYVDQLDSGKTPQEAKAALRAKTEAWELRDAWDAIDGFLSFGASWTATAMDIKLLAELARDMSKGGSVFTKYRINVYNGTRYIIFKGNHRARALVTGTRYLAANTKIANLGIGKLGAAKAVAGGMKITLILTITFRAVDTLMRDEATWHDFVGATATDVVKVGISGGASMLAAALFAGGAAVGTVAVGPLFAAIAVGVVVGLALEYADSELGFTAAVIQGLREADQNLRDQVREVKRQWNWYHRSPQSTVDFWMRVFGARY